MEPNKRIKRTFFFSFSFVFFSSIYYNYERWTKPIEKRLSVCQLKSQRFWLNWIDLCKFFLKIVKRHNTEMITVGRLTQAIKFVQFFLLCCQNRKHFEADSFCHCGMHIFFHLESFRFVSFRVLLSDSVAFFFQK